MLGRLYEVSLCHFCVGMGAVVQAMVGKAYSTSVTHWLEVQQLASVRSWSTCDPDTCGRRVTDLRTAFSLC